MKPALLDVIQLLENITAKVGALEKIITSPELAGKPLTHRQFKALVEAEKTVHGDVISELYGYVQNLPDNT